MSTLDATWFEFKDLKKRGYNTQVWIPLCASQYRIKEGESGRVGYREEFLLAGSLAVDIAYADRVHKADANDVIQRYESRPYVDDGTYVTADTHKFFFEDLSGTRLVLEQRIPGASHSEWLPNQDFVLALNLLQVGNSWICVEEGRTEVLRLRRDAEGNPVLLEAKVEYLKDYLAARKMGLVLGTFVSRAVVIEDESALPWSKKSNSEEDAEKGWRWQGNILEMHEGGMPFGSTWHVSHIRRTDFDPDDEVPNLGVSGEFESKDWTTAPDEARKVYRIAGEIWRTEWLSPGENSPRVAGDKVASTSYFVIDGAGRKVSGDALERGGLVWLWFRPDVVNDALSHPDGVLGWYTADTGNIRFAPDQGVHFGINELGFVNVLAVDIGRLPHWSQAKWAGHNVNPTGKVAQELTASQVSVVPADTVAPEAKIPEAFQVLAASIRKRYDVELFRSEEHEARLLRIIHRFRSLDRESLLGLAKDLTRVFADRVDAKAIQKKVALQQSPGKTIGSLKTLEGALATLIPKERAAMLCGPLFGIYDLRGGSAHLPGREIEKSLRLANVKVNDPFVHQGHSMLLAFVVTLHRLAAIFGRSGERHSASL